MLTNWAGDLYKACSFIKDWIGDDNIESPKLTISGYVYIYIGPLTFVVYNEGDYKVFYNNSPITPIGTEFSKMTESMLGSVIDFGRVIRSGGVCKSVAEYLEISKDPDKVKDYEWDQKFISFTPVKFDRTGTHKFEYRSYDVSAIYDLSKFTDRDPYLNVSFQCGEVPLLKEVFPGSYVSSLNDLTYKAHARVVGISNCHEGSDIHVTILKRGEYRHLNGIEEINDFIKVES